MTTLKGISSADLTARSPNFSDADFTVDFIYDPDIVTPGSETYRQDYDAIFKDSTPATVDPAWRFYPREIVPGALARGLGAYSTTANATVSGNRISKVANGTARLFVNPVWPMRSFGNPDTGADFDFTRQAGVTTTTFIRFADGSLGKKCNDAIDALIAGKDASAKPMYSSYGVRNSGCWIDASLFAASSLNQPRVHAISPWIAVGSEHYGHSVGATLTFLGTDGVQYSRTVSAAVDLGPANKLDGYSTDIRLYLLDSALPAAVPPYKVMPKNWQPAYIRRLEYGVPVVYMDQESKALVADFVTSGGFNRFRQPTDSQRAIFYEGLIGGDSSNGAWLLINGSPVLVTTWTFAGPSGPDYDESFDAINTAMGGLKAGQALTAVDLSGELTWEYATAVAQSATHHWRTSSGATVPDIIGGVNGTYINPLAGADGAIANDTTVGFEVARSPNRRVDVNWKPNYSQVTVNAWFRPTDGSTTIQFLASCGRDCCGTYYGWNLFHSLYAVRPGGGIWNGTQRFVQSSTTTAALNQWHMYTLTYDGATVRAYLDGSEVASSSGANLLSNTEATWNLKLGAMGSDGGYAANGRLQDVSVGPTALPPTAVQRLYRLANNAWPDPSDYREAILSESGYGGSYAALWMMDEASGNFVDVIGGNTGAVHGSIAYGATPSLLQMQASGAGFDGASSWVGCGNATSLRLGVATYEAWFRGVDYASAFQGIVVKQYVTGLFLLGHNLAIYDWGGGGVRNTGVAIDDGENHHVAVTMQSGVTNGTKIYLDGELVLTTTFTVVSQSYGVSIGSGNEGAFQMLKGVIGAVAIAPYIVSQDRLKEHYRLGSSLIP